jgi:hypothetical protein
LLAKPLLSSAKVGRRMKFGTYPTVATSDRAKLSAKVTKSDAMPRIAGYSCSAKKRSIG